LRDFILPKPLVFQQKRDVCTLKKLPCIFCALSAACKQANRKQMLMATKRDSRSQACFPGLAKYCEICDKREEIAGAQGSTTGFDLQLP
jgi:hypothetical protein